MLIRIEFHGILRQIVGKEFMTLQLTTGSVQEALSQICQQYPELAPHLPRVACAIGSEIVPRNHALALRDVLSLIPPVSGGSQ